RPDWSGDSIWTRTPYSTNSSRKRLVRSRGLEPPRVAPLAPQASASTNSATTAWGLDAPASGHGAKSGAPVTNRPHPDKGGRTAPDSGAPGRMLDDLWPAGSALVRRPRQHFGDFDRDAVPVDDHVAFGNGQVAGQDRDLVVLGCVQFDNRATTETQRLMNRH